MRLLGCRSIQCSIALTGLLLLSWELIAIAQPPTLDTESRSVVVLGQPCDQPYVVAVPARDPTILNQVQQLVPTAFLTDSPLGFYVQAGASVRRSSLESLNQRLRRQGLDARIAFRPIRCSTE